MSRDPREDAARWVRQAEDDIAAAAALAAAGHWAQACFLCQQAAVKALKGVLYAAGATTVLGHSVSALCKEVALLAPDVGGQCRKWAALDQFYIPTRYPDALPGGTPSDVYTEDQFARAVADARDVVAFARARLNPV